MNNIEELLNSGSFIKSTTLVQFENTPLYVSKIKNNISNELEWVTLIKKDHSLEYDSNVPIYDQFLINSYKEQPTYKDICLELSENYLHHKNYTFHNIYRIKHKTLCYLDELEITREFENEL